MQIVIFVCMLFTGTACWVIVVCFSILVWLKEWLTKWSCKMQSSENLYEQKPEEAPAPVPSTTNNNVSARSSLSSRFEYVDNVPSPELDSGSSNAFNHVSAPKSSSFFADFGMDSGFPKKFGSSTSKLQVSPTCTILVIYVCLQNLILRLCPVRTFNKIQIHHAKYVGKCWHCNVT